MKKTRPFGKHNSSSRYKTSANSMQRLSTRTLPPQKELLQIPQEKNLLGDLGLKNFSEFSKLCSSILLPLRILRDNVLLHQFLFPRFAVAILSCSVVSRLSVTPWTAARQAPLSTGFSRQEYWSGLPFPPPSLRNSSETVTPEAG